MKNPPRNVDVVITVEVRINWPLTHANDEHLMREGAYEVTEVLDGYECTVIKTAVQNHQSPHEATSA